LLRWTERAIEIIENDALLNEATSSQNNYGGADQMALYQLIGYIKTNKEYRFEMPKAALG